MISENLYKAIPLGTEFYKISEKKKTCQIGVLLGKYEGDMVKAFLVKLKNGNREWISYLNNAQDDVRQEPGWYVLI
jgi:hypothetical protein